MHTERYDVVVIGAGQAGLSVGYHLARQRRSFVIVDGSARIGDSWRQRWDSLRLFTPAQSISVRGGDVSGTGRSRPKSPAASVDVRW